MLFCLQVLKAKLRSKMATNVQNVAKSQVGLECHISAIVSSLAIAFLVHKHSIELTREELISVLSCLAVKADPTGKTCAVYEEVSKEFSADFRG